MTNYYETLRVNSTATIEEIKHSFRVLAHKYHPDKNEGKSENNEDFIKIREAFDVLSDIGKRQEYDKIFSKNGFSYYTGFENNKSKDEADRIDEVKAVFSEIKKFSTANDDNITMLSFQQSLSICKEKLISLKQRNIISYSSYLDVSSTVVRNSLEMAERLLTQMINDNIVAPQEPFKNFPLFARMQFVLNTVDDNINYVLLPLKDFEINQTTKEIFELKNQYYLQLKIDLEKKINQQEKGKGCYIATMVYGDYDHPSVIIFRCYRDTVLEKKFMGRIIVKTYYCLAPYLVKFLKNSRFTNKVVRIILDTQAIKLKKRWSQK